MRAGTLPTDSTQALQKDDRHDGARMARLVRSAGRGLARVWEKTSQAGPVAWFILMLVVVYGSFLPLALFSFNDSIVVAFPLRGFTLRWYSEALADPGLRQALGNSIGVAAAVALATVVEGTLGALAIVRFRYRGRSAVTGLMVAPLVVPWLVTGIAALLFFNYLHVPLGLFTVGIMHVVVIFPFVAFLIASQLTAIGREQEESALDLGATQLEVIIYVLLPQLAPVLGASAILAFNWSFNNFVISYFVSGFQELFPVHIYSMLRHAQNLPVINAISTLISVVQVLLFYLAWRLVRRTGVESGAALLGGRGL